MRRSARFLLVMAAVGLLGGFGYYVKAPQSYQASASVLVYQLFQPHFISGLTVGAEK